MRFLNLLFALSLVTSCQYAQPEEYHIPFGFEGKVIVIYEMHDGQKALDSDGKLVISCDSSGVARIQEAPNEGMGQSPLIIQVQNAVRRDTIKEFYGHNFLTDPNIPADEYCAYDRVMGTGVINGTHVQVSYTSYIVSRKKNFDSVMTAVAGIFEPDFAVVK